MFMLCLVSMVVADGLAPFGGRPSAAIMITYTFQFIS